MRRGIPDVTAGQVTLVKGVKRTIATITARMEEPVEPLSLVNISEQLYLTITPALISMFLFIPCLRYFVLLVTYLLCPYYVQYSSINHTYTLKCFSSMCLCVSAE